MKAWILAASLLAAASAEAMVIECGDGTACAVDDPLECHCVESCPAGGWTIIGEACPPATAASKPTGELGFLEWFMIGCGLAVIGLLVFMPTVLAFHRKHHQRAPILVLNLVSLFASLSFFVFPLTVGFVPVLWFAALIWSLTAVKTTDDEGRIR